VIFFAEEVQIPEVKRRINDEVLPRFSEVPEFLGFVALQSEGSRPEIIAMSFWNDGLEGSEGHVPASGVTTTTTSTSVCWFS